MLSDSSGAILDLMPATGARGSDDAVSLADRTAGRRTSSLIFIEISKLFSS